MSAARRKKKQRTRHFQFYVCANCDGRFRYAKEKDWSDGDALKELGNNFGVPVEECDTVCDDCYRRIRTWSLSAGHVREMRAQREVYAKLGKAIAEAMVRQLWPVILKKAEAWKAERN